ncbi:Uma2 family endonuclease [Candidatus Poribacteria bacterium]|jgi:Uma2 family endonuclease|nr:Uma2 family endonuclease [Candidatus Poribacteria bacterium]
MNAESITLEQFMANDYESYEYVKGELVLMSTPTMVHGEISSNIVILLGNHVRQNQLGRIYTAETTFQIGESGRKPDVAFVSQERLPENRHQASPIPPDLAVEVVSPTDKVYDVQEKALEYLDAGTKMVWVIEPIAKTVTVYRSPSDIKILTPNDTLTGEEVIKGFQCAVSEIFE